MPLLIFFYLILLIVIFFNFSINQCNRRSSMYILLIYILMWMWILSKIGIASPRIWYKIISFYTFLIQNLSFKTRCIGSVNHERVFLSFWYLSCLRTNLLLIKHINVLVIGLLLLNVAFNIVYHFFLKLSSVTFLPLRIIMSICSFTCLERCLFIIFYILTIVSLKGSI